MTTKREQLEAAVRGIRPETLERLNSPALPTLDRGNFTRIVITNSTTELQAHLQTHNDNQTLYVNAQGCDASRLANVLDQAHLNADTYSKRVGRPHLSRLPVIAAFDDSSEGQRLAKLTLHVCRGCYPPYPYEAERPPFGRTWSSYVARRERAFIRQHAPLAREAGISAGHGLER